jgi:antirestriction protein ArdC
MSSIYEEVTASVIMQLEARNLSWLYPYGAGYAIRRLSPLRSNSLRYRGINRINLALTAVRNDFGLRHWLTEKQATAFGGTTSNGASPAKVVKFIPLKDPRTGEDHGGISKVFKVFNAAQVEGLPPRFYSKVKRPVKRVKDAETFLANCGAKLGSSLTHASYSRRRDMILMPPDVMFRDTDAYYGTIMRNLVLWAGKRLRWEFPNEIEVDDDLIKNPSENLIAEIGGAFLCADLGLVANPEIDTGRINAWLSLLRSDRRALVSATNYAQAACDYLYRLQPVKKAQNLHGRNVKPQSSAKVASISH